MSISFIPAHAWYDRYNASTYAKIADSAMTVGNYSSAADLYSQSLEYNDDKNTNNNLLQAFELKNSNYLYFRAKKAFKQASTQEDYTAVLKLLSKVNPKDIYYSDSQSLTNSANNKINTLLAAAKAADEQKVASTKSSSFTSSSTKSQTKSQTSSGGIIYQCRQYNPNTVIWGSCPSDNQLFVNAQAAVALLKANAPDFYNLFMKWVTTIGWDYYTYPGSTKDCEISSGPYLSCGPYSLTYSIPELARTFVREAAAREYWETLPDGTFDYNKCTIYAYTKANQVAAILGVSPYPMP